MHPQPTHCAPAFDVNRCEDLDLDVAVFTNLHPDATQQAAVAFAAEDEDGEVGALRTLRLLGLLASPRLALSVVALHPTLSNPFCTRFARGKHTSTSQV